MKPRPLYVRCVGSNRDNTVDLTRLARTPSYCNYAHVTATLRHHLVEIINPWALPENRSKTAVATILITLLFLTFFDACTEKKMNQHNQNTSSTQTPANDPMSIHQRAIAIDMHVDTVQRVLDEHVDLQQQL